MSLDQLFITLLIVLVVFINVVLPMLRRAVQDVHQDEGVEYAEPVVPAVSVRRRILPVTQVRIRPSQDRPHRPLPTPVVAQRRGRACITANARAMRRGIVLMAVLGPCRGLERSAPPGE